MAHPHVRLEGWGWRHAGRSAWAVRDVTVSIDRGERVLLLGPSGAGKSTLLRGLAGVLGDADEGEEAGSSRIDGVPPAAARARGRGAALLQQDPEAGVILARVGDDVAFGPENLGVPREEIWARVQASLEAVGLDVPLDHSTSRLSGGQQQRLALAGVLACAPDLLLLDEPTANLDPEGVQEVRAAVGGLVADRSRTLIVVEHRVDVWLDLVDRVVVLSPGGGLLADGTPQEVFGERATDLASVGAWLPGLPVDSAAVADPAGGGSPSLTATDLAVGYEPGRPVRHGIDLVLPAGTSTVVTGPNGSGKTALALTLAGLLPPLAGDVRAPADWSPTAGRSPHRWRSRDLLTRIGMVLQEPEHQFVAATVRQELAVGPHALRLDAATVRRRVDELLGLLHLDHLADANPFTLSGGEQRRLSVATMLASRPRVVLLDEPTFGQDRRTWQELVSLVHGLVADGIAVCAVTHDEAYVAALGHRRIRLDPVSAVGR